MRFRYVNKADGDMVDTPMAADRSSATIYINPILYSKLSPFEKKFWTWHEKGHILLNTSDEIAADNFAFKKMAGKEYRSLKQMIEAAENLLDGDNQYHQERINNLYCQAIEWDKTHPLDKATSKQMKTLGQQINNAILSVGTLMNSQTSTTASATQTANNSTYIVIIAVILVVVLMSLMKS